MMVAEDGEGNALVTCNHCGASMWEDGLPIDADGNGICPVCGSHDALMNVDDEHAALKQMMDEADKRRAGVM